MEPKKQPPPLFEELPRIGTVSREDLASLLVFLGHRPFALLSAFQVSEDLKTNRRRNKALLSFLNPKVGLYLLCGYWGGEPEQQEELFFVPRRSLGIEEFNAHLLDAMRHFNLDLIVVADAASVSLFHRSNERQPLAAGVTVDGLAEAHGKAKHEGRNVWSFTFEGAARPGTMAEAMLYHKWRIEWIGQRR